MKTFQKIAVFCGSSLGAKAEYAEAAKQLALSLCQHNLALVYGGASIGIMGVLADTVLQQGGKAIGVIPQLLADVEIAHTQLSELHIVNSMHERKALIAEQSDGFILLPGGAGSLDEFFEMLTWLQLGYHQKPIAILNTNGYYDLMLKFIDQAIDEGFIKPSHKAALIVDTSPNQLLRSMCEFTPQFTKKWIKEPA